MNKAMTGAFGELTAGRYLREQGYSIITTNYRCRMGEIDIIAADKKYICFTEVKTRDENSMIKASDAVDAGKRKRLITTAQFYLSHNTTKLQPRFDVIEVYIAKDGAATVNHIKNAYGGDGK